MFRLIGPLGAGRGGIVVLFFGAVFRLIEPRIHPGRVDSVARLLPHPRGRMADFQQAP